MRSLAARLILSPELQLKFHQVFSKDQFTAIFSGTSGMHFFEIADGVKMGET